jgi:hypothetical protein
VTADFELGRHRASNRRHSGLDLEAYTPAVASYKRCDMSQSDARLTSGSVIQKVQAFVSSARPSYQPSLIIRQEKPYALYIILSFKKLGEISRSQVDPE